MKIKIHNRTLSTPDTWNDMSQKQAILSARVEMALLHKSYTVKSEEELMEYKSSLCASLAPHLLGVSTGQFNKWIKQLGVNQMGATLQCTNVVFDDEKPLFKNHLPHFEWNGQRYQGPLDKLFDLTMDEFITADKLFTLAWQHPSEDYIDGLISCLYRPAEIHKFKPKFDQKEVIPAAKKFEKLPQGYKDYVLIFYKGCRRFIELQFTNIFTQSEDKSTDDGNTGWNNVVIEMSQQDPVKVAQLRQVNLYDFMATMDSNIKKAREAANRNSNAA